VKLELNQIREVRGGRAWFFARDALIYAGSLQGSRFGYNTLTLIVDMPSFPLRGYTPLLLGGGPKFSMLVGREHPKKGASKE
jgi:hypothetical protein